MKLLVALALLSFGSVVTAAESSAPRFITALRAGRPQHVVIYGTSLSKGGVWVPQLQASLDAAFSGLVKLTNSARGGQHSGWGAANVDAAVVAQKPDVVFIEFAINDAVTRFDLSLDNVRHNVDTILDRITTMLPRCEIILQIMNPAVGKPEGDPSHRRNQDAYQQLYRDAAQRRGLLLIDHSTAWNRLLREQGEAGFKKLVPDGVHPNADGWRQVVMPVLLRALSLEPSTAVLPTRDQGAPEARSR
ncbi:MAG: SGNH/GDSL hydrolase family protein [Verrucomicrobia bacterium]|nr:SGNH/GDSL hydrolase family protein [Verrucomicrobiota bacterium]